jgi:3-hydroxyacyl-[acyl-carrier-protein] dehydratase
MRWFWIDRFLEFVSGQQAIAIKAVTLSEEPLDDYLPAHPVTPCSLIIEGLAQTGGLLVAERNGFQERVVLAKVGKATFHFPARPGDVLTYTATILDIGADGAICRGTAHIGDRLQAEVDIVFAHLDDRFPGTELFEPEGLLRTLRLLGVYRVGRTPDGKPLTIPEKLLAAEVADLAR